MFCPKCGTKAPDDAGFCQKCGTKLAPSDTVQPTAATPDDPARQASGASVGIPKRKKKKLPIIIGAIVLLVVILVVASSGGGGGRDNIATVQAHKLFATSQNLPYTFAEVFDKYTNNPVWYTDSEDEKTNTAIVKVDGIVKGTEYRLIVSIKVSPNPNDSKGCIIQPQSVNFDGTESTDQNEAIEFLYNMFAAYDKGYEDLFELLSSPKEAANVELTEVYTNADAGISFRYPANWVITDEGGLNVVTVIDSDNAPGHRAWLQVGDILDTDPLNVFSGDATSIETAVNDFHTFLSIADDTISGVPVRILKYQTEGLGGNEIVQNYYYTNGASRYLVQCTYSESMANTCEKIFNAIIDSYTITPIGATAPSQGIESSEPSQEDHPGITPASDFVGAWSDVASIYQMDISFANDIYTIDVSQQLSDSEWRQWSLEGYSEEGNGIFYSGVYVDLYLRDDGTVGGGGAPNNAEGVVFLTDDGILHWVSDTEELDYAVELTKN